MEVTEAHSEARTSDTENRLGHDTLNDNDGGLDEDKNYDEETVNLINNVAYNYVAFFIVAVGIAGNLINLVVLTRPRLKGVMYVYLLGLAVSNLCVLIIAIPALISLTAPECPGHYATAFFRAHLMMPLLNSFMAWSVYIIICMTVNRYISIYMPTYFQRIHTFKNAYVAIFFSFMGGVILHVPLSFEAEVVPCSTSSSAESQPPVAVVTPSNMEAVDIISYKPKRNFIAEHPLYNVYLWVSETLLRLGPIVTLTILNILIIVRYNRIARKREVLKGAAVHRTPTSKNGACGNNYRRSASPIMPVEGVNGGTTTTNGQFLTVANAQTTGEKISPTALSVTQGNSTNDVQVETDQKTTTTALTIVDATLTPAPPAGKSRSGSVTSARMSALRGTPNRASTRRRGLHSPEERMLVVVLIAIVVLFVVCTTPAAFLTLSITTDRKKHVGFSVFRACANNLELLGFALNFFVYCLCSADIRQAFVDVLFANWLVLWLREKFAKSGSSMEHSSEEHELQGLPDEQKNAMVAAIPNHKLMNVANV